MSGTPAPARIGLRLEGGSGDAASEGALRRRLALMEQVVTASLLELDAANRKLQYLATHDPVTGLPNRVLLDDRIARAIVHASHSGERFALAMLDLDRFKVINESLGHRAADALLNTVARRLSGAVRRFDTVARLGGDRFAVIISRIRSSTDAMRVAHKIMLALQPPARIEDVDVHTSASVGISCFPEHGTSGGRCSPTPKRPSTRPGNGAAGTCAVSSRTWGHRPTIGSGSKRTSIRL
jgi:diguanylate cyclase (GGDEF)-like protein